MSTNEASMPVYGMHTIQALAKYELAHQIGLRISPQMADLISVVHEQPADIKLVTSVINPSLLPFIRFPTTSFDTYANLLAQAKSVIKSLKENTPCTYKDFTFLVSGIYCAKPRELFALWNAGNHVSEQYFVPASSHSASHAHSRATTDHSALEHLVAAQRKKNNFAQPVAHVGFYPIVNKLIEF